MMVANARQQAQYVLAAPYSPPNLFPSPREGVARAGVAKAMPRRVFFSQGRPSGLGRGTMSRIVTVTICSKATPPSIVWRAFRPRPDRKGYAGGGCRGRP